MKQHFFLFALLLLMGWQKILPQNGYMLNIERPTDCLSSCAIAADNNDVIAVINNTWREQGSCELLRIDESGNIIDSLIFSAPDRLYKIIQIDNSIHEGRYLGLGWQADSLESPRYIWIFEFDHKFNIQWERIIDTFETSPTYAQFRHWNGIYFIGVFIDNYSPTFLYKFTESGELLKKVFLPYPEEPNAHAQVPVFYIRPIPESSYFLMNRFLTDDHTAVMNDDLEYLYSIGVTIYPNQNPSMEFPLDLEFFNNTEFIRSGRIEKKPNDFRTLLAVKKMDTASRNEAKIRKFGYEGFEYERGCYPGAFKTLAMHDDYFFSGGFSYRSYSPNYYPNYDNFIMAYAFDYDLDSLWATNIGNDAYYLLYSVNPTPDGGCVLAASRYDWRKGDEKRSAFIVKIPKPDITAIPPIEKTENFVTIFPNPGNHRFFIQTECNNFTFRLYDLQGRLLLTQQNQKEVDTRTLPDGCYIYQMVDENGTASGGKWVKKAP